MGQKTSGKACYGATSGAGDGYINPCIHSGVIVTSGDLPTVWYNYALASAGIITGSNNTAKTNETICPKGWTLPTNAQIDDQRNITSLSPVLGGGYEYGQLANKSTHGYWWGSAAYNGVRRYRLDYYNNSLHRGNGYRSAGLYVRCVQAP